jgi:hypothetical protein
MKVSMIIEIATSFIAVIIGLLSLAYILVLIDSINQ